MITRKDAEDWFEHDMTVDLIKRIEGVKSAWLERALKNEDYDKRIQFLDNAAGVADVLDIVVNMKADYIKGT